MILKLDQVSEIVDYLKGCGYSTGISQGVFDLLHAGHIEHFRMCKTYCDKLFVVVVPDKYAVKGPGRPIYNQRARAEFIDSLNMVSYVLCDEWDDETACFAINLIKPNLYFKGTEYRDVADLTRNIDREADEVRRHGGDIKFLSGNIFSSGKLISQMQGSPEFRKYVKPTKHYLDILDKINDLEVTLIGEGIVDEYISVASLGMANKYPILSVQEMSRRQDEGGVYAIRNLLRDICPKTNLASQTGECVFLDANIVKTRYTDSSKGNKLFEVNNKFAPKVDIGRLKSFLDNNHADAMLICDFGHGAFTDDVIDLLLGVKCSKHIMAQQNSLNGYINFPWKYKKMCAKSFFMNRKELIINSSQTDIAIACSKLIEKLGCDLLFITEGKDGAMYFDSEKTTRIPAVGASIRDTIGCGDVFFAIASLVIETTGSVEDALVMANVFAYLHAQIDGNSGVVMKNDFVRFMRGLQ